MLYRHKFFKIILTHLAKHDILCHKSHWFCGLVWNHPQDVVVFILNTATESGWLSPWDPPLPWGKVHEEFTAPQHTRFILPPIHPTKSIAALHGRNFFFFTNKILCSCSIFQNLFFVVDCTTVKCYSCAWKKQNVVSALRSAFFILYLESCISRLNVIPCHDLTPSVSEPDNAAAQTGAGTLFGANGDSHTWAETFYLFFGS